MKRLLALAAGVVLFGGGVASATAPPATGIPTDEAVVAYLTALANPDPAGTLDLTAPGSAARQYLVHQSATTAAAIAAGYTVPDSVSTVTGPGAAHNCRDEECADFILGSDAAELIESVQINAVDLAPRLGGAGAPATSGPLTAAVLSSYATVTSDVFVVIIDVTTSADVQLGFSASYVGPDGQQRENNDRVGPDTLFAGAKAKVIFVFGPAAPGGTLRWTSLDADANAIDLTLTVPTLAQAAIPTTTAAA